MNDSTSLQDCDLVMKGGITSGVVYPAALKKLSSKYRFRSVGGTSAGAIAAGCAAAAEFGRDSDEDGAGFDGFNAIGDWLGAGDNLKSLFQANPETRPLMDVLFAFLGDGSSTSLLARVARIIGAVFSNGEMGLTAGILLGVVFFGLPWAMGGPPHEAWTAAFWIDLAVAILVTSVAAFVGSIVRLAILAWVQIPKNFFGLCRGHLDEPADRPVLTDWLAKQLNRLAGLSPQAAPLTFGQLTGRPIPINLQMVTTNLSEAQPYLLPFEQRFWIFKRSDMLRLFPADVVQQLGTAAASDHGRVRIEVDGYFFLPPAKALPVIVAMRMSLSFPILLSAVPLYRPRFDLLEDKEGFKTVAAEGDLEKCWFSDGGISSNFPIHFFDSWLPRWPTFGINLRGMPRENNDQRARARATQREQSADAGASRAPRVVQSPDGRVFLRKAGAPPATPEIKPFTSILGFLTAIWDTAQNFRDNTQAALHGYAERIVNIRLDNDEGGLNLAMSPDIVKKIQDYGGEAGQMLVEEFQLAPHQWLRMLVLLPLLEKRLAEMKARFDSDGYEHFIADPIAADFPYHRGPQWQAEAKRRLDVLLAAIGDWNSWNASGADARENSDSQGFFEQNCPRPQPDLRVTPKV